MVRASLPRAPAEPSLSQTGLDSSPRTFNPLLPEVVNLDGTIYDQVECWLSREYFEIQDGQSVRKTPRQLTDLRHGCVGGLGSDQSGEVPTPYQIWSWDEVHDL